jgi:hypothetical protein
MEETRWVPNQFMPILHHLAYGNLGQLPVALWALGLASERSYISPIQGFFKVIFFLLFVAEEVFVNRSNFNPFP